MAQKAAKTLARTNTTTLKRLHFISLSINSIFVLLRLLLFRGSFTTTSLVLYVLLSAPAIGIEIWFERIGRPSYGGPSGADLRTAGEDLEAKGLTEWMWDVVYWTWGCLVGVALLGDKVWWAYLAVPLYSGWLAWTTFGNVKQGLTGMTAGGDVNGATQGESKRRQKMEKRGQKTQYR